MPVKRHVFSFCLTLACLFAQPQVWADPGSTGGLLWVPGSLVGETASRHTPVVVADGVKTVTASGSLTLILKIDGTLWATGENAFDQLGAGGAINHSVPIQVATDVAAVFSVQDNTFLLKNDGTLWAFGANTYGSLGTADPYDLPQDTPIQVAANVKTVSASFGHTLFLKTDNTLWGMGSNQYGQLGLNPTVYPKVNQPVQLGTGVASIAVQNEGSFLIKTDGTLWAMGQNDYGQLGTGNTTDVSTPTQVATDVLSVSTSQITTFFLKTDKTLWGMGFNPGQLGAGTPVNTTLPVAIASNVGQICTNGLNAVFFLKLDHTLWGAGNNARGLLGDGTTISQSSPIQIATDVASVQANIGNTIFLKRDGSLWGTGSNGAGQLGDGTDTDRYSPQQIATSVASFSISQLTTIPTSLLYVTTNGELSGVGEGRLGQLGDGATIPQRLLVTADAIAADIGINNIWYVRSDGSLWSIVDGRIANAGVSGVVGASTDDFDNPATYLKNDGSVWQLDWDNTTTPLPVAGVAQIFNGFGYHLFLKSDGSLWGLNIPDYTSDSTPVFGDGTNAALVATGVTSVSADNNHFLFVKDDHTLWGQGFVSGGWPGGAQSSPTPIPLAADVTSASAQQYADAYLKTDGSLWMVGMGWAASSTGAQAVATNVANAALGFEDIYYVKSGGTLFRQSYFIFNGQLGGMGVLAENVSQVMASRFIDTYIFIQDSGGMLPVIDANPQSASAAYGATLQLEVAAIGSGPLDYQWFKDGVRLPHGRSPRLYLPYMTPADAGNYTVKVTNRAGSVMSDIATVTVTQGMATVTLGSLAAVFDGTPKPATATTNPAGKNVTFTYDGLSTAPTLPGSYAVVATVTDPHYAGSASGTLVIVDNGPVVTANSLVRQVLLPGDTLNLSVTVAAIGSPAYQWYHDGRPIGGAISANLALPDATYADRGAYWSTITNAAGTTRSAPFFVTVAPATTEVVSWGYGYWQDSGQNDVPAGLYNAVAVADGPSHSLALRADGTVVAWGSNDLGESDVPAGLTNVVAIAAGAARSYALKADGTVVGWGENDPGAGSPIDQTVPADLTNVVALATKSQHTVALRSDGTVRAWGKNFYGETDVPNGLHDVVAIAAGFNNSMALKSDGTVVVWGQSVNVPSGVASISHIAVGQGNFLAVEADGTIHVWGSAAFPLSRPADLAGLADVQAGAENYEALKTDGTLLSWGYPDPMPVPAGASPAFAIAAGWYHFLALRDATADVAPAIVIQPTPQTVTARQSASFSVTAAGTPVRYQWRKNGDNIAGATEATLTITNATTTFDAGTYDVVVWNRLGSQTSVAVSLTVNPIPTTFHLSQTSYVYDGLTHSPSILTDPQQAISNFTPGGTRWATDVGEYTATATAIGDYVGTNLVLNWSITKAPVTVTLAGLAANWDGTPKTVTVTTSPTSLPVTITYNGSSTAPTAPGSYAVAAAVANPNYSGSAFATLVITDRGAVITNQGTSRQLLALGQTTTLSVTSVGTTSTTHQWYHDGRPIPDAIESSFTLSPTTYADRGAYWVAATNAAGTTYGAPFFVAMSPASTQVIQWGYASPVSVLLMPEGLNDAMAISASGSHVLALRRDGTVAGWGENVYGQARVPNATAGIVAVAAGIRHSLALKANGTVIGWGESDYGQISIPAGLNNVVAIAAGYRHSLALRTDGTVIAWGNNSWGQINVPSGLGNVVAIAAGIRHSLALKADGTVVAWGDNVNGQTSVPSGATAFTSIAANGYYSLARKDDATIKVWGDYALTLTMPGDLNQAQAVAAGINHALALLANGTVTGWGANSYGESTPPADTNSRIIAVTAGSAFSVMLRDATNGTAAEITSQPVNQDLLTSEVGSDNLLSGPSAQFSVEVSGYPAPACQWQIKKAGGSTWYDALDNGHYSGVHTPTLQVATPSIGFDSGDQFRCVVTNYLGTDTSNVATLTLYPPVAISWVGINYAVPVPGGSASYYVGAFGTGTLTYQWTRNGRPIVGQTGSTLSLSQLTVADTGWYTVLVTDNYSTRRSAPIFLRVAPAFTHVQAWGSNADGQTDVPASLFNAVAIAAGANHVLALRADGTVAGWGSYAAPNAPADLSNVVAIVCGSDFSVALKYDATVIAWDSHGNPVTGIPDGLNNVVALAAGNRHSLALKADGTVVGWGDNSSGQISIPSGLHDATGIAAGLAYSLALKGDGTVVGWGSNSSGALTIPAGLNHVTAIASSNGHVLALKDNGTVVGWGVNTYGETSVPSNLTGVVAIAAGEGHSLAVKDDGTVVAWGRDNQGQVSVPQDLTGAFEVAAGDNFSVTVRSAETDVQPVITSHPGYQSVAPGASAVFTVTASATGSMTYQWQRAPAGGSSFTAIVDGPNAGGPTCFGAKNSQLTVTNCLPGNNGDRFRCVVSNGAGSVVSNEAMLTVAANASDFNGDGKPDIVLQNLSTGARSLRLMNGTTLVSEMSLGGLAKEWSIATTADFNGDGQPDLLLQNSLTGERMVRLMNGAATGADVSLGIVPVEWSIVAAADFNGDGKADLLWQNTITGERYLWFMNGSTHVSDARLGIIPVEWSIAAAADFNGDGKPDILWQNTTTGERYLWFMDGSTHVSDASLGIVPVEWSITAAADFNGDGKTDILWQNSTTRQCYLWFMNGLTHIGDADLGLLPAGWSLAGVPVRRPLTSTQDFNGDGKADILWQNTITGERYLWFMNGPTHVSDASLGTVPVEWSIAATADFNGDGKSDILWQNTITGERYLWFMNGTIHTGDASLGIVPVEWSIFAAADFNGDGKPDILWQNTITGERYLWLMNGAIHVGDASLGIVPVEWSIAAAADFNGDGKADILWQNTATGERYLWFMNGTIHVSDASLGIVPVEWSIAATADFNGDDKADILWQNTTTGERYLWFTNGTTHVSDASLGIVALDWSIAN